MKSSDDPLVQLDVPAERRLGAERKAALKEDLLQRIGVADRQQMSGIAHSAHAS